MKDGYWTVWVIAILAGLALAYATRDLWKLRR